MCDCNKKKTKLHRDPLSLSVCVDPLCALYSSYGQQVDRGETLPDAGPAAYMAPCTQGRLPAQTGSQQAVACCAST